MNGDPVGPGSSGDDLFDLPRETKQAGDVAPPQKTPRGDVDAPSSALPKRQQSTAPAGPPLTSVESSVEGILAQVRRPNPPTPIERAPVAPPPALAAPAPPIRNATRKVWLAFAALALVNGLALGFLYKRGAPSQHAPSISTPATEAPAPHAATTTKPEAPAASETVAHVEPRPTTETKATPVVPPLLDRSALDLVRSSLADARDDVEAGRRASARARLARIGLAIDSIPPANREEIRAEAALLVARSIQADADQAGRTP